MGASGLPPGPLLPRAAQAVLWAHHYASFTGRGHARYGPTFTVRIGGLPTSVVTVDREAIRRLMTGDPLVKRHGNDLLRSFLGERSVMVLEPREHLQRRKLLLPPFHGERVRGYAGLMQRLVDDELDGWRAGEEVRILPFAQTLTLEVILQAVLGISDVRLRGRLRAIFDAMVDVPGAAVAIYYPQLQPRSWWNMGARAYWRRRDELDALLSTQIAATRADARLDERQDILALLVAARDEDGRGLSDTDLLHEVNTLIVAGHETTAAAIAWGVELLAHHPDVRARARTAAEDGDQAYLDALVKEILRIRTPVPVGAARHPLEPFACGEHTIQPGVDVIVNAEGLHHDPAIYPEPERFRPERFDDGAPEYAFLPFGGGAHRCVGAALAQLEIKTVLAAMLRRHDLAPAAETIAPSVRRGVTHVPRGGGRVRVLGTP